MTNAEKAARIEELIQKRRWRDVPAMRYMPRIGSTGAIPIEVRFEDRVITIYERMDPLGRICYGWTEWPNEKADRFSFSEMLDLALNAVGAPPHG